MPKIEFVPPGFDPTTQEYTPDGPSCSGWLTMGVALFAALGIGGLFLSVANGKHAEVPALPATLVMPSDTPTPLPTSTGTVTPVPPSNTPKPSLTSRPSDTPTFVPPPKRVITATKAYDDITYITATQYVDRRTFSTPTPDARPYRVIRQAQIKEAAAAQKTFQARINPTETPSG